MIASVHRTGGWIWCHMYPFTRKYLDLLAFVRRLLNSDIPKDWDLGDPNGLDEESYEAVSSSLPHSTILYLLPSTPEVSSYEGCLLSFLSCGTADKHKQIGSKEAAGEQTRKSPRRTLLILLITVTLFRTRHHPTPFFSSPGYIIATYIPYLAFSEFWVSSIPLPSFFPK